MTDKEKLKEIINDVFRYTASVESEYGRKDFAEAKNQILDLIDRQPTEEDATKAMKFIQDRMDDCQSEQRDTHDCNHCVNREHCDEPKETIRKALGVEAETEGIEVKEEEMLITDERRKEAVGYFKERLRETDESFSSSHKNASAALTNTPTDVNMTEERGWKDAYGHMVPISDMTSPHIVNCLHSMNRNGYVPYSKWVDNQDKIPSIEYDWMLQELDSREGNRDKSRLLQDRRE